MRFVPEVIGRQSPVILYLSRKLLQNFFLVPVLWVWWQYSSCLSCHFEDGTRLWTRQRKLDLAKTLEHPEYSEKDRSERYFTHLFPEQCKGCESYMLRLLLWVDSRSML